MAVVDFSNAVLEHNGNTKPFDQKYISVIGDNTVICDANKQVITSSYTKTKEVDDKGRFVAAFNGTLTTSGTELYIKFGGGAWDTMYWKITNISFNSGDTFSFKIKAKFTT